MLYIRGGQIIEGNNQTGVLVVNIVTSLFSPLKSIQRTILPGLYCVVVIAHPFDASLLPLSLYIAEASV